MTVYRISFAINASNEMRAMQKIDRHGLNVSDTLPIKSIDEQAGLIILEPNVDSSLLTDSFYKSIRNDKDIVVIQDELSIKRSKEIIKSSHRVETQLKRLLMYVLPDIGDVIGEILGNPEQQLKKKTKIEWSKEIQALSFGDTISNIEADISVHLRKKLITGDGLLTLISTSSDFDALRQSVSDLIQPKTVWSCIEPILDRCPCELSLIRLQLFRLHRLRNMAAHPQTILDSEVLEARHCARHIMRYIGKTKRTYQQSMALTMKTLADSMKPIVEVLVKMPEFATEFNKQFSPIIETMKTACTPNPTDLKSLTHALKGLDWASIIPKIDGYNDVKKELEEKGAKNLLAEYLDETESLKYDLGSLGDDTETTEDEENSEENHRKDKL